MVMRNYILTSDESLKALIPPLLPDERQLLEENIARDGCRKPLCVWNNIILDGHDHYEICTRLGIPFCVSYIFLKSREDAVIWICVNQLRRCNISEETKRYLIGKRYEMEKKIDSRNTASKNQYRKKLLGLDNITEPLRCETNGSTRTRIGAEYNISDFTVSRYGDYTQAIDVLSKVEPELASKILSGKIKIAHDDILALSQLSPADIKRVAAQLCDNADEALRYIKSHTVVKQKRHIIKAEPTPFPVVAIKETPAYDPDASVESLVLTIPSWISAIERTALETNFNAITPTAYSNLKNALRRLHEALKTMLDIMEETVCEQ